MHIPDGFLAAPVFGTGWGLSLAGLWLAVKKTTKNLKERTIPLLGVTSAFVFAAQMVDFPVAGGTSGHILGGALAAILLGPYAGALVMALVITVQCLLFQDGGLTELGANIFNMGFIGSVGAYVIYSPIKKIVRGNRGILIGAAVSTWISVVVASAACALELVVSGTSPFGMTMPVMIITHMMVGIVEATVTVFIVAFILKVRPDLIFKGNS